MNIESFALESRSIQRAGLPAECCRFPSYRGASQAAYSTQEQAVPGVFSQ